MRGLAYLIFVAGAVTVLLSLFIMTQYDVEMTLSPPTGLTSDGASGEPRQAPVSKPPGEQMERQRVHRDVPTLEGVPLETDSSGQIASSPATFDVIARSLFVNVYRLLARQIFGDYGVNEGVCIDVGSGPGYLSIELAKITNLRFILLDNDPRVLPIATENVTKAGLIHRFSFITADAQDMPLKDNFADIIVSRASHFFWEDQVAGFREIHRVLKPGGVAFVGAGMGRLMPPEERQRIFKELNRLKYGPKHWGIIPPGPDKMREILKAAGISSFEMDHKQAPNAPCTRELWIEIRK